MGASVAAVNAVIFVNKRLVSMLLCSEGSGHVFAAFHHAAALVIQTYNRWHAVPTWTALEGWSNRFIISNATRTGTCPSRKTGYKGLLLYPRLSLQRACYIMQVSHLVPLVGGECDLLLRTTLTATGICDKGLHLEVLCCHQRTGHTVQVNAFIALIDMVGFRFAGYGRGRVKPCLHTQSCFQ